MPEVSANFFHSATLVASLVAVSRTRKNKEGEMAWQTAHAGEQAILQLSEEAIKSENPFIFSW